MTTVLNLQRALAPFIAAQLATAIEIRMLSNRMPGVQKETEEEAVRQVLERWHRCIVAYNQIIDLDGAKRSEQELGITFPGLDPKDLEEMLAEGEGVDVIIGKPVRVK